MSTKLSRQLIDDPGDTGAIPVTQSGVCHIVTDDAETRTVADPTEVGLRLTLFFLTDGGNAVVTFASPFNVANNNTLTYGTVQSYTEFVSVMDTASTYAWVLVANDTGALSTV